MNMFISIPLWVFILLIVITGWAILSRILLPSVRWFLRRKVNRVLDEIRSLLDIDIKPFQLTKRQVLIDRLVYDPKVLEAIEEDAREHKSSREATQAKVLNYANEIVPSFNAYVYFRIGYWLAKRIVRFYYRVRVGFVDEQKIADIDTNATVVFVMNHRSNMDYLLVTFLAAERTALSYAVGEWARIWPLQTLIKSTGAFFVRRDSKNKLYRRVLERYVHMATKEGVCQALFLEGGLSKDGFLRSPKLGFLDYMLRDYNPETDRDIVFIPVGVNYDRTLEDRSLLRRLSPETGNRSLFFVLQTTVKFTIHNFYLMIRNQWKRFGFACANFGNPISVKDFCRQHQIQLHKLSREERFVQVEVIAQQLISEIETIIPILPVALISTILIQNPNTWFASSEINAHAHNLADLWEREGALISFPWRTNELTISAAFNMLFIRHMIMKSQEGLYKMSPDSEDILNYYANSIYYWAQKISSDSSVKQEENQSVANENVK